MKKGILLNQINILNENQNNIEKIGQYKRNLKENYQKNLLKKFVDEVIKQIIIDKVLSWIYLNLLGDEKP